MTPTTRSSVLLPLGALLLPACGYEEGLLIENLRGTVRVPSTALTRTVLVPDPNDAAAEPTPLEIVNDPRLIGPVYLGLYPAVEPADVLARYPHPEMGPQYLEDTPGDAYPYGGTTVGDIRFACFEYLACKVASGRFADYEDMRVWFEQLGQPIVDAAGEIVVDGDYIQQTCFDLMAVTSDREVRVTAYEDRNDDGSIDEKDLDFVYDEGEDAWIADFTLWQQEFFWDLQEEEDKGCTPGEDCTGFTLWGYMDSPDAANFQFSSCDTQNGNVWVRYNQEFYGGQVHNDLLNFPSKYIATGDWVSSEPFVWKDIYEEPELLLDFVVP